MSRIQVADPRVEHKVSQQELDSLRRLRLGVGAGTIPSAHRDRFVTLGWAETKYGGYVLTALGRYQLEVRLRESGLPLLALRWRHRSEELRTIADDMTTGEAKTLHDIAAQWDRLADQIAEVERMEQREPLLG